ncbi:MAG: GDP-mannose 4,6-dehydratase [Steroidobacteraceae bacterium]
MSDAAKSGSFWRDRRVFVTGGTGLVGGWLVQRLVELEADVVALVRDWVPGSRLVELGLETHVNVVRGDVRDQVMLERVLGEYEVDTVLHLAAQTIVGIANRNPISTFATNIGGTWALLEAVRRSPTVKAVVIASSDKAYGSARPLPYVETTPLMGEHPYDVSKSCADLIAQCYGKTWNVPVAITRCGNFFGGGDLNWNRIVPGTIRSILRGERPIVRSDGKFIRDYIYVEDAVDSYLHLAEELRREPKLAGEAFNFAAGKPLSVLEVVDAIRAGMKSKLEPIILNEASNEIREQHLDSSKAQAVLNWRARFGLEEGLPRTIKWYREHLSLQS